MGHDWGALVAWNLCLFRPDRVKALVNLSVAFRPRSPTTKPVEYFRSTYGDDYYVCKFQVSMILIDFLFIFVRVNNVIVQEAIFRLSSSIH